MLIPFSVIREVKNPDRGHPTDAGMDFFMPKIDEGFIVAFKAQEANATNVTVEKDGISISPGGNACIPSGIKIEIPYGHMGLFLNKSGVASKKDLIIGAQVIDTFYSGEVHIDLHNIGRDSVWIPAGIKLAQMVIIPVLAVEPKEVDEETLYRSMKLESYRDEGGFGSTDKR